MCVCVSSRDVEEHHRSQMHPPWVPTGGRAEGNVCRLMEMGTVVMERTPCLSGRMRITIARNCRRHGSLVECKLLDSREPNTALGIEEPECVYVYVPANVFGANSL